jgi:hypothetical protein
MTRFATGRHPTYATLFDIQRFSVHDRPGRYVAVCPSEALALMGEDHTMEEVLEVVGRGAFFSARDPALAPKVEMTALSRPLAWIGIWR